MSDNLNSGFFSEPAWHGRGYVNPEGKPIPLNEAFMLGGLDWKVEKVPVCHPDGSQSNLNRFFIKRVDTGTDLGIVNSTYQVMQNEDLMNFLLEIAHHSENVECHTLGALGKGERIWMLVKLPGDMVIRNDDIVNNYLTLASSHDGTLAINIFWTPIRVVCQNTLTAALSGFKRRKGDLSIKPYGLTLKHTKNVSAKIRQARTALSISQIYFSEIGEIYRELESKKVSVEDTDKFLDYVIPVPEKRPQHAENARENIIKLFETGKGNKGQTAWDLWNGYVEWSDYDTSNYRNTAGENANEQESSESVSFNRFESIMLNGTMSNKKREAFSFLTNEVVGIDTSKTVVM